MASVLLDNIKIRSETTRTYLKIQKNVNSNRNVSVHFRKSVYTVVCKCSFKHTQLSYHEWNVYSMWFFLATLTSFLIWDYQHFLWPWLKELLASITKQECGQEKGWSWRVPMSGALVICGKVSHEGNSGWTSSLITRVGWTTVLLQFEVSNIDMEMESRSGRKGIWLDELDLMRTIHPHFLFIYIYLWIWPLSEWLYNYP